MRRLIGFFVVLFAAGMSCVATRTMPVDDPQSDLGCALVYFERIGDECPEEWFEYSIRGKFFCGSCRDALDLCKGACTPVWMNADSHPLCLCIEDVDIGD